MWGPGRVTTILASMICHRDSFAFFYLLLHKYLALDKDFFLYKSFFREGTFVHAMLVGLSNKKNKID
jgi:hypothetical protein